MYSTNLYAVHIYKGKLRPHYQLFEILQIGGNARRTELSFYTY